MNLIVMKRYVIGIGDVRFFTFQNDKSNNPPLGPLCFKKYPGRLRVNTFVGFLCFSGPYLTIFLWSMILEQAQVDLATEDRI